MESGEANDGKHAFHFGCPKHAKLSVQLFKSSIVTYQALSCKAIKAGFTAFAGASKGPSVRATFESMC